MGPYTKWAYLVGETHRLGDLSFRAEAMATAQALCKVARTRIDRLVAALVSDGYQFAEPAGAHVPPVEDPTPWLDDLASKGIHLPLFLQAWLKECGAINLTGTHPEWPCSGYAGMGPLTGDIWYTDPLVVDAPPGYILAEYEEWQARIAEDGPFRTGPFQLPIAPDHIHKANVSGGAPYSIDVSTPALDTLILYARDCTSISYHVMHSLDWGGFPGFAHLPGPVPPSVVALQRAARRPELADA